MQRNKIGLKLKGNRQKASFINFLLFVNVILSVLIVLVSFFSFVPKHYAVSEDLKGIELQVFSAPMVTDNGLKEWLIRVVNETFALDFRTYYNTLKKSKIYFDDAAFDNLLNSLNRNKIIELITTNRVICSPIIQKKPVLLDKGMMKGTYIWLLELEFKLSYESSKGIEKVQNLIAEVIIQRADTSKYSTGIKIKQLILQEKSF